ncbi:MAG TPA: hypothetical protein VGX76_04030, partial [Pirellulales bacterium]|nr:hypothetical protein [Pirellulales bacterium]
MLVILSLLALFTLLGLTLVLATSRAKLNALASARSNPQAMRDDAAIDEIVNQIFRGTNDPDSVLRFHSLLEDLYGSPILLGRVDGPPTANTLAPVSLANGQLVSMNVAAIPGNNLYNNIVPAGGEYTGLVITMLNGRAQGRSSRVVGHTYNPVTLTTTLQVIAFDGLVPSGPNAAIGYLGDQFLINGRPFSGTGFGFNAAAVPANAAGIPQPLLTAYDPAGPNPLLNPLGLPIWYYALLPNSAATGFDSASAGGANETYDVPDFQNMILALHYFDPTLGTTLPLVPVPPNMQGFGRVVLNPTKTASVGSKLTPLPSLH